MLFHLLLSFYHLLHCFAKTTYISGIESQTVELPCDLEQIDNFQSTVLPDISKVVWIRHSTGDVLSFNDRILINDKRYELKRIMRRINITIVNSKENDQFIHPNTYKQSFRVWDLFIHKLSSSDADDYACDVLWTDPIVPPVKSHDNHTFEYTERDTEKNIISRNHAQFNFKLFGKRQSKKSTVQSVTLEVFEPPKFLPPISNDVLAMEGDDIELQCNARGNPTVHIRWFLRFYRVFDQHNETKTIIQRMNGDRLRISDISVRTSPDNVECVATNGINPAVSRTMKINIHSAPRVSVERKPLEEYMLKNPDTIQFTIRPFPTSIKHRTLQNERTKIICWIHANPRPEVHWIRMNDAVNFTSYSIVQHFNHKKGHQMYWWKSVLTLDMTHENIIASFRCDAKNYMGTSQAFFSFEEIITTTTTTTTPSTSSLAQLTEISPRNRARSSSEVMNEDQFNDNIKSLSKPSWWKTLFDRNTKNSLRYRNYENWPYATSQMKKSQFYKRRYLIFEF
ncbi:hypothetical protein SNEBB_011000 [Seison nebaliae]|nr:hypothetical protein SNEBB_011000 [Seison nebaliae]